MKWLRWIAGASTAVAVILATSFVVADAGDSVAGIVHGERAPTRVVDGQQARIVPLHQGQWGYLGEFRLEAGAEFARESRQEEEFLYVLSGTAMVAVDGQRFLLGPRMGVHLPAEADVQWHNGSEAFVAVQVFAGPSPGIDRRRWRLEPDDVVWPRPRKQPRPAPSELSLAR